jgi:hypothetical protein
VSSQAVGRSLWGEPRADADDAELVVLSSQTGINGDRRPSTFRRSCQINDLILWKSECQLVSIVRKRGGTFLMTNSDFSIYFSNRTEKRIRSSASQTICTSARPSKLCATGSRPAFLTSPNSTQNFRKPGHRPDDTFMTGLQNFQYSADLRPFEKIRDLRI